MASFLFTSESVSEGHPDKLCDFISDSILDACLEQDPDSKVACETATKSNFVMVFGELYTKAQINVEQIVRNAIREVGYNEAATGIDWETCTIENRLEQQSPDISQAVHLGKEEVAAGDQGIMFGYACDETPELMPMTHQLAGRLASRMTDLRKDGTLDWLRPDSKTQVTMEYRQDGSRVIPVRVDTIIISTQHAEGVTLETIRHELMERVVKEVVPAKYLDDNTIYFINPSGRFVIGGPAGDAGLTGRKIIVDTYGGWGAHGGGCFSGKDYTKVDRSGSYMARWIAKSLVNAGLCQRCLVQLSYAIGVVQPISIFVDTYGTGNVEHDRMIQIIKDNFDCRPGAIVEQLALRTPRFAKTAAYGHFGREGFEWEVPKPLNVSTTQN